MNALNRVATVVFDVFATPFEVLGTELAIVLMSGVFGILALLLFKQISWQKGIKAAKDRIKGHMIAIRIYQDDMAIVGKSVGSVMVRNVQYLGLNVLPILPLMIPFVLVMAQFVVHYGFDPLPLTEQGRIASLLPGDGTMIDITMKPERKADVKRLEVRYPAGIVPVSPLARNAGEGIAVQEVVATQSVAGQIELLVDGQVVGTKEIAAGDARPRRMQPTRVSGFWPAWIWPAEETFDSGSPIATVSFRYPDRELAYMPDGAGGIVIVFLVASMAFGALILKPLNIQI